jgi:O2-independent ubiquinone biosynthesis accessory factor UbiT
MHLSELIPIPVVMVPLPLTVAVTNLAYQRVLARHPTLFDRLEEFRTRSFAFVPTDLPVIFIAIPNNRRIEVRRKPMREAADVRVEAPFGTLLRLLQGDADGDALFFARDIRVEGDMEALLALRNTLDDARVDLAGDLFGDGPLATMARALMRHLMPDATKEAAGWN